MPEKKMSSRSAASQFALALLPLLPGPAALSGPASLAAALLLTGHAHAQNTPSAAPKAAPPSQAPTESSALVDRAIKAQTEGKSDEALRLLREAIQKAEASGNKADLATVTGLLGTVLASMGQTAESYKAYATALRLTEELNDKPGQANALSGLGNTALILGHFDEAIAAFRRAVPLQRAAFGPLGEARMLNYIGAAYRKQGKTQPALEAMNAARALARDAKDAPYEAQTLLNIAKVYQDASQLTQAAASNEEALALSRNLGNKLLLLRALTNQGTIQYDLDHLQEALRLYAEALPLARALADKDAEASLLNSTAFAYSDLGDSQKALEYYTQALSLRREMGDKSGTATTMTYLGSLYSNRGETVKAREYHLQALAIERELNDKASAATTLNHLGLIYAYTSAPQAALRCYVEALALHRAANDKLGEGATLDNIGDIYARLNQPAQARAYIQAALVRYRTMHSKSDEATALNNLGTIELKADAPRRALSYFEAALPIMRATSNKDGLATVLSNIGTAYDNLHQPRKALLYAEQALALGRELGDPYGEAISQYNIGVIAHRLGRTEEARSHYEAALDLARQINYNDLVCSALDTLALLDAAAGNTTQAQTRLHEAVNLYETQRSELGGLSGAKVSLLASALPYYHAYIRSLLKQNKLADAFAWTQKVKARALLDLMANGRVDLSKNETAEERTREAELRTRTSALNAHFVAAASRKDTAEMATLKMQIGDAESELHRYQDTLYARHPDLADKRAARTLTLDEAANRLPSDTALLEYVSLKLRVGGDASNKQSFDETVLLCLTRTDGKTTLRAYTIPVRRDVLAKQADAFRKLCATPGSAYAPEASRLYRLLVAPAASQLAGKKRLIICPDGPLWNLPFAALRTGENQTRGSFLLTRYEIDYAYSATAASAARKAHRRPAPTGSLLVLANPNFGALTQTVNASHRPGERPLAASSRHIGASSRHIGASSRHIGASSRHIGASSRALAASSRDMVIAPGANIPALPGTQREADVLRTDFPNATILTGKAAQKSTVKAQAGNYRYLHFATHGFLNDTAPLLSSIVLAAPPPGSKDDNFLTAREIFDMNLNADLVVLSACNTARGAKQNGEGVIGLTWALFVAGASSQIVSQWAVNDASTATLMQTFYDGLTHKREGKGAALRNAALTLQRDGKHAHPYYWAPFVLVGDWK